MAPPTGGTAAVIVVFFFFSSDSPCGSSSSVRTNPSSSPACWFPRSPLSLLHVALHVSSTNEKKKKRDLRGGRRRFRSPH